MGKQVPDVWLSAVYAASRLESLMGGLSGRIARLVGLEPADPAVTDTYYELRDEVYAEGRTLKNYHIDLVDGLDWLTDLCDSDDYASQMCDSDIHNSF